LYLHLNPDPRVGGVLLLNPWVRSAASQQRTVLRHYYLTRLTERGFWVKLVRGGITLSALFEAIDRVRTLLFARLGASVAGEIADAGYQERMARALAGLHGPALVVLSADHVAADRAWQRAMAGPRVSRLDLPGADHTLSASAHRQQLEAATVKWLTAECMPCLTA
jgi:hypothetical protein